MNRVRVSAVSYINTIPLLYGIESSGLIHDIDLSLDIPSVCADKLINGEVDLGLVPIAILSSLKDHQIISDYCIGALGPVDSVALYSRVPLGDIEEVYLDYQSRTSVALTQVLANKFWKINPKWLTSSKGYEKQIREKTAGLIIGDRAFEANGRFEYKYDLAEEWFNYTKLPFVFACWVTNKELPVSFIEKFNCALRQGVESIEDSMQLHEIDGHSKDKVLNYLKNNISYELNANKMQAIEIFLQDCSELKLIGSEYSAI